MKTIMIVYNQSLNEMIMKILDDCSVRGFTKWVETQGRGTKKGEPRYGTHAWPSKNMVVMAVVDQEHLDLLIPKLKMINDSAEKQGLRAFTWETESVV